MRATTDNRKGSPKVTTKRPAAAEVQIDNVEKPETVTEVTTSDEPRGVVVVTVVVPKQRRSMTGLTVWVLILLAAGGLGYVAGLKDAGHAGTNRDGGK